MLPQAYLTDKQLEIWRLRFKGLSKAEVGRRLGITRQAVYDAEKYTLKKVASALRHVAEASMIEVHYLDPSRGVLLGQDHSTSSRVIVTFSARNGVQTWHYEQPDCGSCRWVDRCKQRLMDEAEGYARLKDMGTKVSEIARLMGKGRPYVSHSMRLLKLHPKIREAVRQQAIPREQALTLLRLESEQQIALAGEVMQKGLTTMETRDKIRGLLGKELKWRLVPIRIEPAVYDMLVTIAPEGDVSQLLK